MAAAAGMAAVVAAVSESVVAAASMVVARAVVAVTWAIDAVTAVLEGALAVAGSVEVAPVVAAAAAASEVVAGEVIPFYCLNSNLLLEFMIGPHVSEDADAYEGHVEPEANEDRVKDVEQQA